ncbi:MAG: sigma-54 dependent transcriptional regulator [Planctomycetota bacterium]|jgi:DNA-binding NtrC family response regulator|nr:sigma-54 dependent transcriptional regulator [Planctomycetota bacterium]MDP6990275.1 sigma-54 dependent transcriptional regulator [Planctomycetota bacterium]
MTLRRILIIDSDPAARSAAVSAAVAIGREPQEAADWAQARACLCGNTPDAVIAGGGVTGPEHTPLVEAIRQELPDMPVVLLGAAGETPTTAEVLAGPASPASLKGALDRAERTRRLRAENAYLRSELVGDPGAPMIAKSTQMIECLRTAARVARSAGTILVTGERGTGKERLARAIHQLSPRRHGPYIRFHCAGTDVARLERELFGCERGGAGGAQGARSGRFELADGGTLVLDEVGELPGELQARLLRALEEREFERVGGSCAVRVDVRVIATTSKNLPQAVAEGCFDEDLYYRLHVLPLALAPLRARPEDVVALAEHFIERFAVLDGHPRPVLSDAARERLVQWPWPGNVSELEIVIQRAVVLASGEAISEEDLCLDGGTGTEQPPEEGVHPERDLGRRLANLPMADIERYAILATLESTGGNKTEAGRRLGLTARTLSNKLKLWRSAGLVA